MEEIKQFDIVLCNLENSGAFKEYGVRPCIVVSNNACNEFSSIVYVVPLTTSAKKPMPTHCVISSAKIASIALCENIIGIERGGVITKQGELNEFERINILYCLKQQLGIK